MEDEVLNEALEAAREQFYEDWLVAPNVEEREKAHGSTLALAEVLRHLVWLADQYEEPEEEEESILDTL
jgi:hypothetical protein